LEVDVADNTMIKVAAVGAAAYVAYLQGWFGFLGIGAPATVASSTPAAGASAAVPATPGPIVPVVPMPTGANSLSGIQAATILAANAPAAGLSVDQWGYYLNAVINPLGIVAPDPLPLFSAAIPGFDRSQLVTSAQYWSVMGPALKPLGFSGLGMYWRTN
jgi:hypothetical protein